MQLNPNDVHVWSADLAIQPEQEKELLELLSPDECIRANRFRLSHLRQRFIASRGTLRRILCLYLNVPPQKIAFTYSEHGKPSLFTPDNSNLQFNLAHSNDIAVYALTLNHAIGIDIEKVRDTFNAAVAKRYFSPEENAELQALPEQERILGFYRLWSRKEAIVKALGKGLVQPLTSFTVPITDALVTITVEEDKWSLMSIDIHSEYPCAVASNQIIQAISQWQLSPDGTHKMKR